MIFHWTIRFAKGNLKSSRITSWITFSIWMIGIIMLIFIIINGSKNNKNQSIIQSTHLSESCNSIEQARMLSHFNEIQVEGYIELNIVQDTIQKVVVSSQNDYQNTIKTMVDNNTLKIYTEGIALDRAVKITVYVDSLEGINAKGACSINSNNQLISKKLNLKIKGACETNIDAKIENDIELETDGASEITLTGMCETLKINSAGASDIKAENMQAKNSIVELKGASEAKVYASNNFEGDAMGVSHIKCFGHPKNTKKEEHLTSSIIIK
jgi:hypothetical protein